MMPLDVPLLSISPASQQFYIDLFCVVVAFGCYQVWHLLVEVADFVIDRVRRYRRRVR